MPGIYVCCYCNCTARETEVWGGELTCVVACPWEKPLLDPASLPVPLPGLLEAADMNAGIAIEQAWVLILPCFVLVWGNALALSEPLFLHRTMGEPAHLPAQG